jgi:chromodomain-helicase-DNA-binding protein 1
MMSTPAEGGPSNGHLSPIPLAERNIVTRRAPSESDLSDAGNEPMVESSHSPSDDADDASAHIDETHVMSESDESSQGNASDDAEFDMPDAHVPSDAEAEERASSSDSNRATKRKAPAEEDDYIRANPELYGLRRSVRNFLPRHAANHN